MPQLKYGIRWTIYMLMATHPTTAKNDGKSQFRADVEADANGAADLGPSVIKIFNNNFGLDITSGVVGSLPQNFSAENIRNFVGFSTEDYDPSMGPCPDSATQIATGKKIDNQSAIAQALLAMSGPVVK